MIPLPQRTIASAYGQLAVYPLDALYTCIYQYIDQARRHYPRPIIGFNGGSTPKAFYQWAASQAHITAPAIQSSIWTTSDERCVPIDHDDSNFGHLKRLLLDPLGVPPQQQLAWPTDLEPENAAVEFEKNWTDRFGHLSGFDLCFLGLGEDGHTASLFPSCALLSQPVEQSFQAVYWPGRGWRLTITPQGLSRAKQIVLIVTGASKKAILETIFTAAYNPMQYPVHLLKAYAAQTIWLIDEQAWPQNMGIH